MGYLCIAVLITLEDDGVQPRGNGMVEKKFYSHSGFYFFPPHLSHHTDF